MPVSISRFSRTFLAFVVANVAYALVTLDQQKALLARNPQTAGMGDSLPIFSLVFATAIWILLWFLIVKRASVVAKWVLTVIVAVVSVWTLASLKGIASAPVLPALLTIACLVLQLVAVSFLFAEDARAWFGQRRAVTDSPLSEDEMPGA